MAGPVNWLSQVGSITKFGLMGVPQRLGSVAAAVCGIAGVVTVLVGVLSIAAGFRRVMEASGSPDSAIVLRSGSDSEMVSGIMGPQTRLIADAPGVARDSNGPLTSAELFVIINLPKRSTGQDVNVPLRGVEQAAFRVRDGFKIVEGRNFEWGKNEVIAGIGAAREFSGLRVGERMKVGSHEWPVVGVFAAGGGAAESEVWTDARVLQGAYNRGDSFQSVYAKLKSAADFDAFKDALTTNPQLNVGVSRQTDYFADQSTSLSTLITTLGYLVASLMAVGAVFGAFNTMYSSVSTRTREIATLRALGFGSGAVVAAVMFESVVLSLVGGTAGALIAYIGFNGFHAATINWQSFSQVTFAFMVTPQLLFQGILLATLIGLLGGLWPAVRAAGMPIADALRDL
jgi:putative ABC transport system permease protein